MRRILVNMLLVAASVGFATAVFVLGYELVARHRYERWKTASEKRLFGGQMLVRSEDPVLMWENRPGFKTDLYSTNRWGFRDTDFEVTKKPAGTYRLAFVGDSVTFATSVRTEELFSSIVGNVPPVGDRRVQSMNFSVNGYNALQIHELVRGKVVNFEPDKVIYVLCLNDFDFDDASGELRRFFHPPASFLWDRITGTRPGISASDYHEYHFSRNRERVFEAIRGMQRVLARRAIMFGVVVLPVFDRATPSFRDYRLSAIHRSIERFLDERKIQGIDLLPTFQACSELPPSAYSVDVWHMNALGHRFVSRVLTESVLADPGSAPKGVPETVCKELQELRTDEEPSETVTTGASESMTLPVTSKQLNLGNFWPVEDAGGKTYAWSRDRGTIEITRLRPRTSFRVKLHLTDSAGRSKANIGTTGGALAAVPITALDIELPERVVSDDIGRMNIALEVEPWHPDGRTGDNRLLGVAVSSVLLSASP